MFQLSSRISRRVICVALMSVMLVMFVRADPLMAQPPSEAAKPSWITDVIKSGASTEILNAHSPSLVTWDAEIARLQAIASTGNFRTPQMLESTKALEEIGAKLRTFINQLKPKWTDASERLAKLGPPPAEGKTEAEYLADQRNSISDEVASYDGLIKRAEVLLVQAGQVAATFNATRRKRFVSRLLQRSEQFNDATFWREALKSIPVQTYLSYISLIDWTRQRLVPAWNLFAIAVSLSILIGLLLYFLLHRVVRTGDTGDAADKRSRAERGAKVLRRSVSVSAPILGALLTLGLIATSFDLFAPDEQTFIAGSFMYFGVAVFLVALLWFAFRPRNASERLLLIGDRAAPKLFWILAAIVLVWMSDQVLSLMDRGFYTPLALTILRSLTVALTYAVLLGLLLLVRIDRPDAHPVTQRTNGWPRWLFGAIALFALLLVGSVALGYISLGRFAGNQLVATGGLLLLVTLVHLTAEFLSTPRASVDAGQVASRTVAGATTGVVIGLSLDILVLLIGFPVLLLQWGFDWIEVRGWVLAAFVGFKIGGITFSFLTLFLSLGILLAGLLLTRVARQMFLRRTEHVFGEGSGVRDSVSTVLMYVGFVLSVVAALSYLGVAVTNLALVAGALSVGIGFGLQSIANNFVSGLILLAERPIKAGDWIVVGDREGIVQKISVRSTQLRTFDRSTVIIPNADLITGQVINWDHGDTIGRVTIDVGVAYGTDTRKVLSILNEIGAADPRTIHNHVSPLAVFEGFGDSSLDFSLRVHIYNVRDRLHVATDMRVAIAEAFEENKIEIPFPQRDIHIKDSKPSANSGQDGSGIG